MSKEVKEYNWGIECRKCGCRYHRYTRPQAGSKIARRRICRHCGHEFTTFQFSGVVATVTSPAGRLYATRRIAAIVLFAILFVCVADANFLAR